MKKKISIVLSAILIAIIIFLVIFSVFSVVSIKNNKVPFLFGFASVELVSGSMSPKYEAGDILLIKKISADKIEIGDVITFISSDPKIKGSMNTHRVVGITLDKEQLCFITKGDANPENDEYPVYESDLVGRVVMKNTVFSKLFSMLRSQWGYFAIIMLPLLAVLAFSVHQFAVAIKNNLQEETHKGESDLESEKDEK